MTMLADAPLKLRRRVDLALGSKPVVKLTELLRPGHVRRSTMVGAPHRWRMHQDFQMAFLRERAGLRRGESLLDLGCGNLRAGVKLVEYLDTGRYWGVEARAEVLDDGRRHLREAGLEGREPHLVVVPSGGLGELSLDAEMDVMWAFAVLIHFSDDVLDEGLGFVRRHLAPGGAFYANVNQPKEQELKWLTFPVSFRPLEAYEEAGRRNGLHMERLGTLADVGYPRHASGHDQPMLRFTLA